MGDTSMTEHTAAKIISAVPTFLVADIASTARWYEETLALKRLATCPTARRTFTRA